jgi:myo-inositol 2-dehydrogenase/D-chiro-inositol 1-dehydrogenase
MICGSAFREGVSALKEKVRVGVIGAGAMGLHHSRSLAHHIQRAELASVADPDEEAGRRAAALAPGAAAMTDHQALLADPDIDAVIITSPNDTHALLIEEASKAGKHVFCEKPLALDLPSADAALAAVAKGGVKLQVGFQRRFDPGFRKARSIIQEGELGQVELIVSTTRDPKPPSLEFMRRSGGLFRDTLIHDLDCVRFLSGLEAVGVYATASTMFLPGGAEEGFVDTAITSLRLETGALAVITNSLRAAYGYEVASEALGEKGKITVGQEQQTGVRRYRADGVWNDHVYRFLDRFRDAYLEELTHFIECVALDRQPEVSGEDGRAALVLALLAARSYQEGRPLSVEEAGRR